MRNPNAEILEYVLKFLFSLAIIDGISVVVFYCSSYDYHANFTIHGNLMTKEEFEALDRYQQKHIKLLSVMKEDDDLKQYKVISFLQTILDEDNNQYQERLNKYLLQTTLKLWIVVGLLNI